MAGASEQRLIFLARDRLGDTEFHGLCSGMRWDAAVQLITGQRRSVP
jgi:hypothetical protein